MEDTVTNYQFYMNVCRNPFGYSSDEVRTARLYICDHAESMDNLVGKLTRENEALKAELAEAKKDAERWNAISTLMFIGNLELNQDEDGGYSISVDPVENIIPFGWVGNSPEGAIDKAVAKIASLEEDEKLNTEY